MLRVRPPAGLAGSTTDRARAAYDHFIPLDGRFDDNVVLQVKHGPMDFQVREAVSPLLGELQETAFAVELQVTQEYTGQQQDLCYLGPWWREILQFDTTGSGGQTVAERTDAIVAVANVGDDPNWTGHKLAQSNLYAYGRLAWDPGADPVSLLHEWAAATFAMDDRTRSELVSIMAESWQRRRRRPHGRDRLRLHRAVPRAPREPLRERQHLPRRTPAVLPSRRVRPRPAERPHGPAAHLRHPLPGVRRGRRRC